MNIIEILIELQDGEKIRRKGWENIALIRHSTINSIPKLHIYDLISDKFVRPYIQYKFSVNDILADDWEVVE